MIPREQLWRQVEVALRRNPVVALLGPRQCGKTTLARHFLPPDHPGYFDLEDPVVAALMENPMTTLQGLRGWVVIDEAQRQPRLFPVLRVLADRADVPARFLLLGSATPALTRQASESLAGRIEVVEMQGFGMEETGAGTADRLWERGGFPRSFLAASDEDSVAWRREFVRTFLERDLGMLGFGMAPAAMGRFWTMLAHYHGQVWNGAEIAASMGVAPNTVRAYLDALEQTYMIRRLLPWHANLAKRIVKSPKIYFRDTGILHALLGVRSAVDLRVHPKLGASWEGFALEQVVRATRPDRIHFHAVHSGSEIDLLLERGGQRWAVEFKRSDAPAATRSLKTAMHDLELDQAWIVYPGPRSYRIDERIEVRPLASFATPASGTPGWDDAGSRGEA